MESSSTSRASSGSPLQVSKSHVKAHALELFRQVEACGELLEPLRGSVLHFDEPFEPVGENDRDALAIPLLTADSRIRSYGHLRSLW